MGEIRGGVFVPNETNRHSFGGTETMARGLANRIEVPLLQEFQIVCSRVRELEEDKIRIFWAHDLPGDPESEFLSDPKNHECFHLYVFVSNWQAQRYIDRYNIPWSKVAVIPNAIEPFPDLDKSTIDGPARIVYSTTPHRGLDLLCVAIDVLSKKHDLIFDVYSSFDAYGWGERDEPYKELFEAIGDHPNMNYHGFRPNDEVRSALEQAHCWALPGTWPETSCISLIEAMSAKCACIHSNHAALFETAGPYTGMYAYTENRMHHVSRIVDNIDQWLFRSYEQSTQIRTFGKLTADFVHSWKTVSMQWTSVLEGLSAAVTDKSLSHQIYNKEQENV